MGPVKILTYVLLGIGTGYSARADNIQDFHRRLADFHAPAIIHQVGKHPKADVPTRYDFDGDNFADNNWKNLENYDVPPAIYYEVIESETHFFITYALFHPRDYTNFWFCLPRVCHENDLEGSILTVRKDGQFGTVEFVEALAHLSIKGGSQFHKYVGLSRHQSESVMRPVLRVESGGHGIYLWDGKHPEKYVMYLPEDDASLPKISSPIARYGLRPMSELWDLRHAQPNDRIFSRFYNYKGRFTLENIPRSLAGRKYGRGLASLPWAWGATGAKRGEWFLDPAEWVYRKLKNPSHFSRKYIYHPYTTDIGTISVTDLGK